MFESVGWCRCLNIQVMPWVILETIIGPIEIKHTWSPETKMDIRGLVLDFYFKFNIYQYKS
jgi:hypothetical protein